MLLWQATHQPYATLLSALITSRPFYNLFPKKKKRKEQDNEKVMLIVPIASRSFLLLILNEFLVEGLCVYFCVFWLSLFLSFHVTPLLPNGIQRRYDRLFALPEPATKIDAICSTFERRGALNDAPIKHDLRRQL